MTDIRDQLQTTLGDACTRERELGGTIAPGEHRDRVEHRKLGFNSGLNVSEVSMTHRPDRTLAA